MRSESEALIVMGIVMFLFAIFATYMGLRAEREEMESKLRKCDRCGGRMQATGQRSPRYRCHNMPTMDMGLECGWVTDSDPVPQKSNPLKPRMMK